MTREERERAIEKLSDIYTGDYRLAEALKLAIESLKSEPRYLYDADTGKYKELTSGDCIDRKHLLNEIADLAEYLLDRLPMKEAMIRIIQIAMNGERS